MKKHLHKFETTLWLFIKFIFYISLMMAFVRIMGRESIGLTQIVPYTWNYRINIRDCWIAVPVCIREI